METENGKWIELDGLKKNSLIYGQQSNPSSMKKRQERMNGV